MRKLLCLLSAALLLFSCNDVDEFGQLLPDSVTLDELKMVSDLTYEELEALVPNADRREEMRRNGGLLFLPGIVTSSSHQTYEEMIAFYSDDEARIPSGDFGYSYWDGLTGSTSGYEREDGFVLVSWYDDQLTLLPGATLYCKIGLRLHEYGALPGFADKIQDGASYYHGQTISSEVRTYRYPNAPVITDFYLEEGDVIQGSFRVTPKISAVSELPVCGLCYSATNSLPTVEADEVVEVSESYWDGMTSYRVDAIIPTGGTYYVRAFARGENGEVSYSPVRRASCQGLWVNTDIVSISDVSEMGYNELSDLLQLTNEGVWNRLRTEGGLLINVSSDFGGAVSSTSWGLSAVTDESYLPQEPGYIYGRVDPIWGTEDGRIMIYWHPAESFSGTDSVYYYKSVFEVYGNTNSLWACSDVQSYTMRKPIVTYFSINSYDASVMNLSWYIYWGSESEDWRAGVCYSTATDLPTVDDNIVELEDQEFTINWDTPLAPGVYYFRFFVQTAKGIGYSPVQRVEITEDMTR